MENKIFNEPTQNIDPATGFVVGSEEYNRAHNLIKNVLWQNDESN